MAGDKPMIWVKSEAENFAKQGWTGDAQNRLSGKSVCLPETIGVIRCASAQTLMCNRHDARAHR
jgi:hypothetical protein